jgi:hypothetical protein
MRMTTSILAALLALACGLAQAQAYRWVDKDGKVRYGDAPPPGVKATPLKGPPGPAVQPAPGAGGGGGASAAAKDAAKDAKKGPMTAAEQEQAYRERQLKAKEAAEKAGKEQAEAEQLRQSCASAQESLRTLERGTRISTVNAAGETVYMDDDQRATRMAQTRKVISETCK